MMVPLIAIGAWLVISSIIFMWSFGISRSISVASQTFHSLATASTSSLHSPPYSRNNNNAVGFDPEYPFNNVVNTFFPVDALIEYNTTTTIGSNLEDDLEEHSTVRFVGRYASFSNIIETEVTSEFKMFPNNGCSSNLNETINAPDFYNKVVILKRGDCTFVDKVKNVVDLNLEPKAIIVGNDEYSAGLITMYSGTYNLDGSMKIPILFITLEDYERLNLLREGIKISISTASIGSWINLVLSMALSPPLLILSFYTLIKLCQRCRTKQKSRNNVKLVNSLPVYIYNVKHLIIISKFKEYLKLTNQQELQYDHDSSSNISSAAQSLIENMPSSRNGSSHSLPHSPIVINGIDLKATTLFPESTLLFSPDDYYPAYKCSICLDHFKPLKSKVLVLECKHFFHQACLSNWLINFRRSCPLCNSAFKSHQGLLEGGANGYGTFDLESQLDAEDDDEREGIYENESHTESDGESRVERGVEIEVFDQPVMVDPPAGVDDPSSSTIVLDVESPSEPATTTESITTHDTDDASFYSAVSEVSGRPQPPSRTSSSTKYRPYSKPSDILSQYGGGVDSVKELSSSIDEEYLSPSSSSQEKESEIAETDVQEGDGDDNETDVASYHSDLTLDGYGSNDQ